MQDKMFIPTNIKVGYNERNDCYSKKLAYIIYYDHKNVLRKEKSWKSWIQSKMGIDDFENKPLEGFVLNKNAGGGGRGWDHREEKIRIYDPRGFEIEITTPNLLFILFETNSFKGKALDGEFIYGWQGDKLILIPTGCEQYQNSIKFSKIQSNKVASKDLIVGATYQSKKQETLTYLGRFNCYGEIKYNWNSSMLPSFDYVFYDGKNFLNVKSLDTISNLIDETIISNFAELIEKLNTNNLVGKIKSFEANSIRPQMNSGNQWPSYDVNNLKGHEYNYRDDFKLIEKWGNGSYFLEISPNTFQVVNLIRRRKIVKKDYNDTHWEHESYGFTSSKLIIFENDEITVKAYKNPTPDKAFTKQEILALNFTKIKVISKSGKKYELLN